MKKNQNIPQEIIAKATRLAAIKGCTKTVDQIIEMLMAEAAKKAKKSDSKKDAAKWEQRRKVAEMPEVGMLAHEEWKERRLMEQRRAAGL